MNITLNNIGIIKNSTIELNGLTVVTGKNNSGKTTVGKVLYALIEGVSDIRRKAESDRIAYMRKQLENVRFSLETFRTLSIVLKHKKQDVAKMPEYTWLFDFLDEHHIPDDSLRELKIYARILCEKLKLLDTSNFYVEKYMLSALRTMYSSDDFDIRESLNKQREKAIEIIERAFITIEQDNELIDYARESINQTLCVEFSEQIQPVRCSDCESHIKLYDDDAVCFSFDIINNIIVKKDTPVFLSSPYKKIYFIDDPFVLDELPYQYFEHTIRGRYGFGLSVPNSFFNASNILPHRVKLKYDLVRASQPSVFEQTVIDDKTNLVYEKILEVIPGKFEHSKEGNYYIHNGVKLKISNLATGSKMFSIIKMLMEKGELDSSTVLVLDEPEAHLHPKWQNQFAELIVLIVKYLNVNVLLTTHSPNFMLALDAYMRKYDIAEKTNFYQTESREDGSIDYFCVNDDMGRIYADFLDYLSKMKVLRNKYLGDFGDETN